LTKVMSTQTQRFDMSKTLTRRYPTFC